MSNKAGEERGVYWWVRYVIVPVIGGGGIIAIIAALIMKPLAQPTSATPTSYFMIQTGATLPEPTTAPNMQWTIMEGHIVLDPNGKYWEKYQDDLTLPGVYLRLKDVSSVGESLGDYLELKADETFVLEEGGNHMSGTWQSNAENEITLISP